MLLRNLKTVNHLYNELIDVDSLINKVRINNMSNIGLKLIKSSVDCSSEELICKRANKPMLKLLESIRDEIISDMKKLGVEE